MNGSVESRMFLPHVSTEQRRAAPPPLRTIQQVRQADGFPEMRISNPGSSFFQTGSHSGSAIQKIWILRNTIHHAGHVTMSSLSHSFFCLAQLRLPLAHPWALWRGLQPISRRPKTWRLRTAHVLGRCAARGVRFNPALRLPLLESHQYNGTFAANRDWRSTLGFRFLPKSSATGARPSPVVLHTAALSIRMRLEEGMNLAHRQGIRLPFGFFSKGTFFTSAFGASHRAPPSIASERYGCAGTSSGQAQDGVCISITHESACHGETKSGVVFETPGHKLVGGCIVNLRPLSNSAVPSSSKMCLVLGRASPDGHPHGPAPDTAAEIRLGARLQRDSR